MSTGVFLCVGVICLLPLFARGGGHTVCIYVCMYVGVCMCMCVYVYVCVCVCVCVDVLACLKLEVN